MQFEQWDRLRPIGLTPAVMQALAALDANGDPMRVIEVHRDGVIVTDGESEFAARLLPVVRRDLPPLAAGDWVAVGRDAHHELWVRDRMPPINELTRRDSEGRVQPLVSNVDTALLVMGLDGDFNLRRLERYLAMVTPAGLWPVVVLTKADLAGNVDARRDEVSRRIGAKIDVHTVNALDPSSAATLAPYLGRGHTLVLLGSSGAGKSTLTNVLIGRAVQVTGVVRADDSRGRHTTTARSLHRLPGGACVIDTPGLRGLAPDIDEAGLAASFEDIQSLSTQCRFRDCTHTDEPGCAVRAGVAPDRLANYQKMLRDIRRDALTPLQKREVVSMWKARHRAAAVRMKMKRG
ncbi:MAG TPA: ribosome small subunit-dependent GTPase A [Burkholderiaceae bacterium]|nr:ribosome small subunit-dependent GTPase A [Burkholderiaceae bacterium]